MYVTYLTLYRGNILPPFYIGYTTEEKILKGYKGSVKSKQYQKIWKQELKANPQKFTSIILSTHKTKEKALEKEEYFQRKMNVHKNPLYINQNITGKLFTHSRKGHKHSEETKKKIGEKNSIALRGRKASPETIEKLKGKKHTEEYKHNLSIRMKNNTYNLGRKASPETIEKLKGKDPWNKDMVGYRAGIKQTTEHINKRTSALSKKYIITFPTGEIKIIQNLNQFCRDNNLLQQNMWKIAKGLRKSHKGFSCVEYPDTLDG